MAASALNRVKNTRRLLAAVVALIAILILFLGWKGLLKRTSNYTGLRKPVEAIVWNATGCEVPEGGFKAWKKGLVTSVEPELGTGKNCSRLIAGKYGPEESRIRRVMHKWKSAHSYKDLVKMSADCSWLAETFKNNLYNTKLEQDFPLAFSFIVYESPEQFLRLFRLLYRPQNIYCIHPDRKSKTRNFFTNLAHCFSNVMISSHVVDVQWGEPSLLVAQMSCLSDLLNYRDKHQRGAQKWRYVVNLCGKELPLTSTAEMARKMMNMNGTSSVVSWRIPRSETWTMARLKGRQLPHNLDYYKSMTYNALSAQFVQFLLRNSTAKSLYKFFLSTDFPEEHFYACLFRMPGAPGGYDRKIPDSEYFEVGHYFWRTNAAEMLLSCFGKTVHGICVVNFGDLPRIMKETDNGTTALFQNKYFMELDHVAMDCMEERIVAMNKGEFEQECSDRQQ